MPILVRYIAREYLKIFLLSLSAFISIYLVVSVFQGMGMITQYKPPLPIVAKFYIMKIPKIISETMPVAVLLSTLMTLGLFSRNSEVTAMKSCGISLYLIVAPILLSAMLISVLSYFSNEYIVPLTTKEARYIEKFGIKKKSKDTIFTQNMMWFRGDNAFYNIQLFNPDMGVIKGICIYYTNDRSIPSRRLEAGEAIWDGKVWKLKDCREDIFSDGGIRTLRHPEMEIGIPLTPDDLKSEKKLPEEMNSREMKEYVNKLREGGYDARRYEVDLYAKLSYPFAAFIMAFLGVPFAIKSGRSSGIAIGIGISVLIGFGYWIAFSFGLSLGRVEALPPMLAAWGTNLFFGLIAVLMIMKMEGE